MSQPSTGECKNTGCPEGCYWGHKTRGGLGLYVPQCKICGNINWDDIAEQLAKIREETAAPKLIGPLTAEEWCEFRTQLDEDAELLRCCAETSNVRDEIFHILRNGPGDTAMLKFEASAFLRHVWWPMERHGIEGRCAELLKKMHAYYVPEKAEGL